MRASRSRAILTRARVVVLVCACACVADLSVVGAASPDSTPGPARRSISYPIRTMGTYANVILVTADSAAGIALAQHAHEALHRIDSLMTNWTTTSEVARINRVAAEGPTVIDPEVARVVDKSLELWRDTDHAFDITVEPLMRAWGFLGGTRHVPTEAEARAAFANVGAQRVHFDPARRTIAFDQPGVRIDLGGIAKGFAADVALDSLLAHGATDAMVDLSGNMAHVGSPVGSDSWRIGIRDPRDRVPYFARVRLEGEAVATAGKYEQFVAQDGRTYGHIMDPRTGRPAEGLISVTILAHTAFDADAWDTPLFVLGLEAAKRKAKERADIDAVLVAPGAGGVDTVWVESSLRDRFQLEASAESLFQVEYF